MSQAVGYSTTPPSSSSRFSLQSITSSSSTTHTPNPPSLYGSSQNPSSSTINNANVNPNRRESARSSIIPSQQGSSSLQQQLFGSVGGGGGAGSASNQQQYLNILDRPLNKTKAFEVALSSWAFMFSEIVSYSQSRVDSVTDLEKRLSSLGYEVGQRILSLILLRNTQTSNLKDPKREHRLIPILQFVHTQIYKFIFGKPADGLERSSEAEDEYMLISNESPLTQFISVPKDMSDLSCEAFTAGLVEGVLDGLDLPARVTAHWVGDQYPDTPQRTVILIKLDGKVMDREEALGK
ncbi:uncharacterized protein I303_103815 [Kwoniella dejecticola CBS 10117]|uniref:BET3 family protein n=1 Tax=Kwoniella dejecticola CBS 10117 TaxID=1296121 RepID=A0A1A6A7T0_9TREE|nr:BET3 family protein [Kwoniella dejecticola CBS 10117]OBR86114.1 BET3 family protein [Kwoniella dejecticola CBS 10117]